MAASLGAGISMGFAEALYGYSLLPAIFQVVLSGVLVFIAGILIGNL
jgi:hypothetical protein